MRVVGVIFAALVTLGLAALGVVAAQKTDGPGSPVTRAAHVMLSSRSQEPISEPIAAPVLPAASAVVINPPAPKDLHTCSNPEALGISRVVEIDTTGGPAFGTEHFKQYDFLRDEEVMLTFDDGPWPHNTPMVLRALGQLHQGDLLRDRRTCRVASRSVPGGSGSGHDDRQRYLSHKDLTKNPYANHIEQAKRESEMGVSAVQRAVGGSIAPFFHFPDLQQPAELVTYLGTRDIATFSTDIDTLDFKLHRPEDLIESAMIQLAKRGRGILLMHDFQHATAEAMPELLRELKAGG